MSILNILNSVENVDFTKPINCLQQNGVKMWRFSYTNGRVGALCFTKDTIQHDGNTYNSYFEVEMLHREKLK